MHHDEIDIFTYKTSSWQRRHTSIITETPVSLIVNNQPWLTFMCTPTDLEALAAGFLFNEGIIQSAGEIANIRICPGDTNIDVWLNRPAQKPETWIRTSGCSGGETSIDTGKLARPNVVGKNGAMLTPAMIIRMVSQLIASQDLYRQSGGVHTSALSNGEEIVLTAEDIGRHNTLDKLAGRLLLNKLSLSRRIILTTGRISSEMIQKAGRMGASVVISRTSPTSLSVKLADNLGITLVGYARADGFSVYTHPERIHSRPKAREIMVRSNDQ